MTWLLPSRAPIAYQCTKNDIKPSKPAQERASCVLIRTAENEARFPSRAGCLVTNCCCCSWLLGTHVRDWPGIELEKGYCARLIPEKKIQRFIHKKRANRIGLKYQLLAARTARSAHIFFLHADWLSSHSIARPGGRRTNCWKTAAVRWLGS